MAEIYASELGMPANGLQEILWQSVLAFVVSNSVIPHVISISGKELPVCSYRKYLKHKPAHSDVQRVCFTGTRTTLTCTVHGIVDIFMHNK